MLIQRRKILSEILIQHFDKLLWLPSAFSLFTMGPVHKWRHIHVGDGLHLWDAVIMQQWTTYGLSCGKSVGVNFVRE